MKPDPIVVWFVSAMTLIETVVVFGVAVPHLVNMHDDSALIGAAVLTVAVLFSNYVVITKFWPVFGSNNKE